MKILRSRKALSPVVASIILIAVTVAVSIAVAAWMGALTFGFMGSSSLTITNVTFATNTTSTLPNQLILAIKNTGTKQVTIGMIKVNNIVETIDSSSTPATATYNAGAIGTVVVDMTASWINGNPYAINLYDGSGNGVGSTQQTAPGA